MCNFHLEELPSATMTQINRDWSVHNKDKEKKEKDKKKRREI